MKSPPIIILNITSECNYKCIMCWQNDSQLENILNYKYQVEMDFDILEKFLRNHADYLCLVRLHGGEPLLYKDIKRLINLLNELKIPFNIVTNGSLLTKELSKILVNGYCVGVGFSLDTADPENYKNIRRNGDLYNVSANIKFLNDLKSKYQLKRPVLSASMCAFSINIGDMTELVKFCSHHKIPSLSVAEGDDLKTSFIRDIHLIKNHIKVAHESIQKASKEAKKRGVILRTRFPSLSKQNFKDIPYHEGNKKPRNCLNLYSTIWILPDFEVIGCSCASISFGNMQKIGFEKLWNSEGHGYVQSRLEFRNKQVPPTCMNCTYTGSFFS